MVALATALGGCATRSEGASVNAAGGFDASPPGDMAARNPNGDNPTVPPIDHDSATIYNVYAQLYSPSGMLSAVTSDLARIHDLGFDTLYLMPVTPIGAATYNHPSFGSPYCVHDYYAVSETIGNEDDLTKLVQAAHQLGMHVILDEVLNHTAWDNALITLHPEYYLHSDGDPTNLDSIEQAFNFADVAQLDYKTPGNGTAEYMTDMLVYWVSTFDIDGFRFDTADDPAGDGRMIPASFWQSLRAQLEAVKPGLFMLGEAEDAELFDMPFDLDYGWQLQGVTGAGGLQQVANGASATLLEQAWLAQKNGFPSDVRHMTLLQDWDLDEDFNLYGGAANTMAAATFDFTIDGIPMLFNGEEVGNDRSGVNTQTPIDWTGPNAKTFSAFYASLLALRNGNPALQQGAVEWITNSAPSSVVSYTRSNSDSTFLVVINFGSSAVTGTLSGLGGGAWTDVSPVGSPGGTMHAQPPAFTLAAHDFAVFRR